MIILANESQMETIKQFCLCDPIGARIYALAEIYSGNPQIAQLWLQEKDDKIFAAFALFDGCLSFIANEEADYDEIKEFIAIHNPENVFTYENIPFEIEAANRKKGRIMQYSQNAERSCYNPFHIKRINSEYIKYLYNIIYEKDADTANSEAFSHWYTDVSHRLRHDFIRIYCVFEGDVPVSVAMSTAETPNISIIGSVATHRNYRKRGFAAANVANLAAELAEEGKDVYLFCDENSPVSLYKKIGFSDSGIWLKSEKIVNSFICAN